MSPRCQKPLCALHRDTLTKAEEAPDAGTKEELGAAVLVWPAPEELAARGGQQHDRCSLQGWVGREASALPSPASRGARSRAGEALTRVGWLLPPVCLRASHALQLRGSVLVPVTGGCSHGTAVL